MEIYIVIFILMVLCSIALHYYKIKQQRELQNKGLINIQHIKSLITLVQNHRGLSSAWLNGDNTKQGQLTVIENKSKTEIQHLEQEEPIIINSRWMAFIDHWGRLNKHDSSRDPENNFTQHTQLISNLLYLLEDEAERSHLNALSLPNLPSIGFVWRELVVTTETIGQSRAIGTGVATRKTCSNVHKIRLSFLQQNIQKTMNETLTKLSSLERFAEKHVELLKTAKSKMQFLSTTIERELISANEVTINQNEYFELATDSIKALDNIFDHQMKQIGEMI